MSRRKLLQTINTSNVLKKCQVLLLRILRNHLQKQRPSTSNKTNTQKAGTRELLERIAINNESRNQTDFLRSIDSLSEALVIFEAILFS